jgi:phytoene synthase
MAAPAESAGGDLEALLAILRTGDRDRYFAVLFAPAEARQALAALYAFALEIARVRDRVSDALPGEMRLQWWRDLLGGEARGDARGSPVARCLVDAIERYNLPVAALQAMIEARSSDLYDDPPATVGDLEGYCGETSSVVMRLASLVLAGGLDPGGAEAAGYAGVAYGLSGLLRAYPWNAAAGRPHLPEDLMQRHGLTRQDALSGLVTPALSAVLADLRELARKRLGQAGPGLAALHRTPRLAMLPAALVPDYLDAMERPGYDPFRTRVDMSDLRRLWRYWRARG